MNKLIGLVNGHSQFQVHCGNISRPECRGTNRKDTCLRVKDGSTLILFKVSWIGLDFRKMLGNIGG